VAASVVFRARQVIRMEDFYKLKGIRGCHAYEVMYWKNVETEKWVVQLKHGSVTTSLGTYKTMGAARVVASKKMEELYREHGHKRGGCKITPRET
jgi:hypothetical protein